MQVRPSRKFFHRYLPIPRQLVEGHLNQIPDAQLRVYLYLVHRTVGYNKLSDDPTVDEICGGIRTKTRIIDVGTGLKRSTVKRALKALEEAQWISVERKHNHPNRYTISKFLRVRKWTFAEPVDGSSADPQDGPFLNPDLKQESINNTEATPKVVSFPRRQKKAGA